MPKILRHLRRRRFLLLLAAALAGGAGCAGAVHTTNQQLSEEAMKPITVPLEAYDQAAKTASKAEEIRLERLR